jgi:hypothetical protein
MQKVRESELILALRARKRELYDSRLPFLSGGSVKGAVAFRIPTAEEEWLARIQSAQHLAKHGANMDADKLSEIDFASVWLLSIAYRNAKAANEKRPDVLEPAFLPTQLLALFTPDQLGEMLDEVMDKRAEVAGEVFDPVEAESYRSALEVLDTEGAVELLSGKSKAWLMAFAQMCCAPRVADESIEFL